MSHTPEPWIVRNIPFEEYYQEGITEIVGHLVGQDYPRVCFDMQYEQQCPSVEDMTRIVACVNACAGMENPNVEIGGLKMIAWTNEQIANRQSDKEASAEHKKMMAIRNAAPKMLAALEYVIAWHRAHDSGEGELYELDYVKTCIDAVRRAKEEA